MPPTSNGVREAIDNLKNEVEHIRNERQGIYNRLNNIEARGCTCGNFHKEQMDKLESEMDYNYKELKRRDEMIEKELKEMTKTVAKNSVIATIAVSVFSIVITLLFRHFFNG